MCTCVSCCGPSFAHSSDLICNLRLPDDGEASAQNTRRKGKKIRDGSSSTALTQLETLTAIRRRALPVSDLNRFFPGGQEVPESVPLFTLLCGWNTKRINLLGSSQNKTNVPLFVFSPLWSTSSVSLSDAASSSSSRLPRVMMKSLGPATSASSADRKSAAQPLNTPEI